MAQGHCPGKNPLRSPAVVRSYPVSPAVEPVMGVVTPESSPVKSRLEGDQCIPFVSLLIKVGLACHAPEMLLKEVGNFSSTYTNFDK